MHECKKAETEKLKALQTSESGGPSAFVKAAVEKLLARSILF